MKFHKTVIRSLLERFRGHHILEALIHTMCGDDPEVLKYVRKKLIILRCEKFIHSLPLGYMLCARFSLYILEYAVPPIGWKLRPFSKLPMAARAKYLASWWESPFYMKRLIFKMLTTLCTPEIFSEPRLLESLGYGPSLKHRKEQTCLSNSVTTELKTPSEGLVQS